MKTSLLAAALCGGALLLGSSARADLVMDDPFRIDFTGAGIGSVNTILSIQANDTETGMVGFNGTEDFTSGADEKTGASQTQTRTFGELGLANASDLRLVINLNENDDAAFLESLVLNVYDPTGAIVFTSGAITNLSLTNAGSGIGNAGFAFKLDDAQAATLQGVLSADLRIGAALTLSETGQGFDTLYAVNVGNRVPPQEVIPEPGTFALLGAGLLPMAGAVIRRRKA